MNARTLAHVLAILLAGTAIAADNSTSGAISGPANGTATPQPTSAAEDSKKPTRVACLNRCTIAQARCSRDVRQARQECSRKAAMGGRDPFTGRADYGYFCSYFEDSARNCGSDYYSRSCQARLAQRYGLCLETMQNIASMRYDCIRSERDATHHCREELSDCKAACQ